MRSTLASLRLHLTHTASPVAVRKEDNLPAHIKGTAYWKRYFTTPRRSAYHTTFTTEGGKEEEGLLELINDHWYALEWTENNYWTSID